MAALGWPAGRRRGLAAHPARGGRLRPPQTGVPRPGRGTDRLRHGARQPLTTAIGHDGGVQAYADFAKFYDEIMGDRQFHHPAGP